jgi:hypothetical protein
MSNIYKVLINLILYSLRSISFKFDKYISSFLRFFVNTSIDASRLSVLSLFTLTDRQTLREKGFLSQSNAIELLCDR